jgi:hypothetical protein
MIDHEPVAGLVRARRAAFFGSIEANLRHILLVDLRDLARLEGRPDCSPLFDDGASGGDSKHRLAAPKAIGGRAWR